MTGPGAGRDRGSATVWAAVSVTVLCVVVGAVLATGQVVAARHRAASAADLSALAAADEALSGVTGACSAARRVAAEHAARLARCVVRGEIADVTAVVRVGPHSVDVRARAGPRWTPDPRAGP